ncbi:trmH [Symbiodinium microadriaticum]|nr:trmH [Symbiodinium sp. KB8]CAE7709719.1 trmH [Symbiodinium microadriaticum]
MVSLIILIPFAADENCDLDQMSSTFQSDLADSSKKSLPENVSAEVKEIKIVHSSDTYTCSEEDVVIVFGHGGKDNADLTNNQGQRATSKKTLEMLETMKAQTTRRILFMCCYSAMEGHLAHKWKAKYPSQMTFGGLADIASLYNGPTRSAREELRQLLQGYRIFATTLEGRCLSTQLAAELTGRDAFVFGNEARGVSDGVIHMADRQLQIPMAPGVDSLNVGVAVGVVLHTALAAKDGKEAAFMPERLKFKAPSEWPCWPFGALDIMGMGGLIGQHRRPGAKPISEGLLRLIVCQGQQGGDAEGRVPLAKKVCENSQASTLCQPVLALAEWLGSLPAEGCARSLNWRWCVLICAPRTFTRAYYCVAAESVAPFKAWQKARKGPMSLVSDPVSISVKSYCYNYEYCADTTIFHPYQDPIFAWIFVVEPEVLTARRLCTPSQVCPYERPMKGCR